MRINQPKKTEPIINQVETRRAVVNEFQSWMKKTKISYSTTHTVADMNMKLAEHLKGKDRAKFTDHQTVFHYNDYLSLPEDVWKIFLDYCSKWKAEVEARP